MTETNVTPLQQNLLHVIAGLFILAVVAGIFGFIEFAGILSKLAGGLFVLFMVLFLITFCRKLYARYR